jgi:hypothetical protein
MSVVYEKYKNIELTLGVSKKVADIAVVVGIKVNLSKHCLGILKCNHTCDKVYEGSESAALCYALYETIRDKMVGSPLEVAKSKVSNVNCDNIDDHFLITFNTQGSISALRKNIGLILSSLAVHKLFTKYSENIKMLKGKVDRDEFNHLANNMNDAIKKVIKIVVIGKIKTDKSKIKEMLEKVYNKLQESSNEKGTKPEKHDEFVCDYPKVDVDGIAAIVVADYILSKSGGMGVSVNKEVTVYNKTWDTKKKSLASGDKIKDYVNQKYVKLSDEFAFVLGYIAITRHLASCCIIGSLIKSNPKPATMVGLIQNALK